ncbi:MAG: patatin-like phospholipase family protein, partial [Rhodospirillaceae bacterium]|nr:patatin-like phospholipase family protein [Rhodospirillaceae bacterium]
MAGTPDRAFRELRIGLVLYGGASLAVYMNGIVTELWQVLRASQARQGGGAAALTGSAAGYRELLDALAAAEGTVDLRIVVDAIAGTSAGGLNGAVLAKAIIDGGDAAVLNEVWINDGDIERLRAEPALGAPRLLRWVLGAGTTLIAPLHRLRGKVASLPGLDWAWARDQTWSLLRSTDGGRTVLDGTYFTEMIADTFRRMDERRGPALLPRYGTLDLFLTRTDFHGWPRHLPVTPLFEKVPLYERTHAHWMRFSRRPRGEVEAVSGFDEPHADFSLTYATRTTAGFPVAFAPVSYAEVADAFRHKRPGDPVPALEAFARRHLPEHRLARSGPGWDWAGHAWMVDGGILDNKPFSYVTEAI